MSDAIMQWEIDRRAAGAMASISYKAAPGEARNAILHAALDDVIRNHGTLVVVSTADKLTVVQRADAPDLEEAGRAALAKDGEERG